MSAAVQTAEAQLLRAIAARTGARVAAELGISPARFSDAKGDGLVDRAARLVVACGYRLVPVDAPNFEPEYVAAMETLAALYMREQKERQRAV
jgi:hypothetical protein